MTRKRGRRLHRPGVGSLEPLEPRQLLAAQPVISEFMAINPTWLDGNDETSDWIEIANVGDEPVSLNGWYLTDDADALTRWQFPQSSTVDLTLGPGDYLVVIASGNGSDSAGRPVIDKDSLIHTNFKLGDAGESLVLVMPDGQTVADAIRDYPQQVADISYGRYAPTGDVGFFLNVTPGFTNSRLALGFVDDTKFSVDRGFHDEPFQVEITSATPGATIRYTLDGSEPGGSNGLIYQGPITISRTTTLRATALRSGYHPSNVDTQTYVFVDDVIEQSPDGRPPNAAWPAANPVGQGGFGGGPFGGGPRSGQTYDYGMDPDVTRDPRYADLLDDALLSIPSISIVTDLDDLFDPSIGIYANAQNDGRGWEVPASVELLNPDGTEGFQIDAGLRIRGGVSRSPSNPKHSFRLFFRSEYGDATLKYPFFGDEGTDEFRKIDLRTAQNFSWNFGTTGGIESATWIEDPFTRYTMRDMGQPYTRGNFVHLYLNGQYWGLYQTEERPEANYAASYLGGVAEDYDAVKSDGNTGEMYATDGSVDGYLTLWSAINEGVEDNADYFRIQGMNPDGTPNPDYPRLLDVDNLIDYMTVVFFTADHDMPLGPPGSGTIPRNLYAVFNRDNPDGVKFITHDSEHSLRAEDGVNVNVVDERLARALARQDYFNPWWAHLRLIQTNDEYRMRFADRAQEHFFNGGALTPEAATRRWEQLASEIDLAIIAESARWGDALSPTFPRTRDDDWLPAVNRLVDDFFEASPRTRSEVVLNQFQNRGWYPRVTAPTFNQHGGRIDEGFQLAITAPSGTIYYTTDGNDPRQIGGGILPGALVYDGSAVPLTANTKVMARAMVNGQWSALSSADFRTDVAAGAVNLVISELNYHPYDPTSAELAVDSTLDDRDFEFIEFLNRGDRPVDLSGVRIVDGVKFEFGAGQTLAPGGRTVIVSNADAFSLRYPGVEIGGEFQGQLSNGGETIVVRNADDTILRFTYDDAAPWPDQADGQGSTLELVDSAADASDPNSWRGSTERGGSPGQAGIGPVDLIPGDSNGDGQFDQLDIVAVLQAGKYNTGQPASRAEGDWNLDGVFNSVDIVVALQTGNYSARSQRAFAAVSRSVAHPLFADALDALFALPRLSTSGVDECSLTLRVER